MRRQPYHLTKELHFQNCHSSTGRLGGLVLSAMLLGIHSSLVVYEEMNLTSIPIATDPAECTSLIITGNSIPYLVENSFVSYPKLVELRLNRNKIRNVLDGAFNNMFVLRKLSMMYNDISQLPSTLGPPTTSLIDLKLWSAFQYGVRPPISHPFFAAFVSLKILNLGYNAHGHFNASFLPGSLTYINLGYARFVEFPDFSSHTPNLEEICVYRNPLQEIPRLYLKGMLRIRDMNVADNLLTTVPDLYNVDFNDLRVAGNPLECNYSLCWIRMWPWIKSPVLMDTPTCETPASLRGKPLMEIAPTDLQCYKGEWMFRVSLIRHEYTIAWSGEYYAPHNAIFVFDQFRCLSSKYIQWLPCVSWVKFISYLLRISVIKPSFLLLPISKYENIMALDNIHMPVSHINPSPPSAAYIAQWISK